MAGLPRHGSSRRRRRPGSRSRSGLFHCSRRHVPCAPLRYPAYASANHGAPVRTLQEPVSLSAIIPTLDAADRLPSALASLRARGAEIAVAEIIVADGGSTDDTAGIARRAGARV